MSQPVTLGDLVKYVLEYRKGSAFKGYDEHAVADGILNASNQGTMLYSCRTDGSVCGIVVASANDDIKEMWIHDILVTEPHVFRQFIRVFKERWPEHNLAAKRKQKEYHMNTNRVCSRILEGALI